MTFSYNVLSSKQKFTPKKHTCYKVKVAHVVKGEKHRCFVKNNQPIYYVVLAYPNMCSVLQIKMNTPFTQY